MDCIQVRNFIYDYLDGELDKRYSVAFAAYVRGCRDCFERCEFEIILKRLVKKYASQGAASFILRSRVAVLLRQF